MAPDDIDLGWFAGDETVLITAGAGAGKRGAGVHCPAGENVSTPPSRHAPWCASRFALSCPSRCASPWKRKTRNENQRLGIPSRRDRLHGHDRAGAFAVGPPDDRLGAEGLGRIGVAWRVGELAARRDALLPLLAGRSIFDIEELHALGSLPPAPLRAAVEMACWDLIGQAVGQPLCRLLGGEYRRRIPLAVRLSGRKPERLAQLARELAAQGFRSQVIGSSGQADLDRQMLHAVRDSLGDGIELRLDGLARYGLETARDSAARSNWTTCNSSSIRWRRGRFSRWPG